MLLNCVVDVSQASSKPSTRIYNTHLTRLSIHFLHCLHRQHLDQLMQFLLVHAHTHTHTHTPRHCWQALLTMAVVLYNVVTKAIKLIASLVPEALKRNHQRVVEMTMVHLNAYHSQLASKQRQPQRALAALELQSQVLHMIESKRAREREVYEPIAYNTMCIPLYVGVPTATTHYIDRMSATAVGPNVVVSVATSGTHRQHRTPCNVAVPNIVHSRFSERLGITVARSFDAPYIRARVRLLALGAARPCHSSCIAQHSKRHTDLPPSHQQTHQRRSRNVIHAGYATVGRDGNTSRAESVGQYRGNDLQPVRTIDTPDAYDAAYSAIVCIDALVPTRVLVCFIIIIPAYIVLCAYCWVVQHLACIHYQPHRRKRMIR
jgi:hypothetical protein